MPQVLVTGSDGLIGSAVCHCLEVQGYAPVRFDLKRSKGVEEDIRLDFAVDTALRGCAGVIHLAAVSRVIHGERDPTGCIATNVGGTRNVLRAAARSPSRPWVIFASSREVYGEPETLPVSEDAPLRPINVYGRSKAEAEAWVQSAREEGLTTAIVRFSNVYGSTEDHADRVVPAFARAAATGAPIRVDGRGHTFDFTHLEDTLRGLLIVVDILQAGERRMPAIHLLTGTATTLSSLAQVANDAGGNASPILDGPERSYDVRRFLGDPSRSRELLGWTARTPVRKGVSALVAAFRAERLPGAFGQPTAE
jgi:nucleoside-diphosphate-sugar epimerase